MELLDAGDQVRQHKQAFFNSNFSTCYKCGGQDLQRAPNLIGIDGIDEVGVDVFTCNACPWVTAFRWSSTCQQKYTEPADAKWPSSMSGYPVPWVQLWCKQRGLDFLVERVKRGNVDGTRLMDWQRRNSLQKELKLADDEAAKLQEALNQRNFSLGSVAPECGSRSTWP